MDCCLNTPENTLTSFRACLDLRVSFEFDVRRTKDGHLVCLHDKKLNRTTNIEGKVSELTFDQIRAADAGSWFDPAYAGEVVPSIEEIFQLISKYKQHDLIFAVDVKVKDCEEELIRLAEKYDILNRLVFLGLAKKEQSVHQKLVECNPQAQCMVVAANAEALPAALADPYASWIQFADVPRREEIQMVTAAGKHSFIGAPRMLPRVPDLWQQVSSEGMDAILTDYAVDLSMRLRHSSKSETVGSDNASK